MSLLLPSALFALLALALPLLIHLQRRRETPPPRLFAALAYIDPQARPKQRVRLRDRLLLLLRVARQATAQRPLRRFESTLDVLVLHVSRRVVEALGQERLGFLGLLDRLPHLLGDSAQPLPLLA